MEQKVNDFWAAFDLLSKVTGTIACGCQMTAEEEVDALVLWRMCKKYDEEFLKNASQWKKRE